MRSELFTMILGKLSRTDSTVPASTYSIAGPLCATFYHEEKDRNS